MYCTDTRFRFELISPGGVSVDDISGCQILEARQYGAASYWLTHIQQTGEFVHSHDISSGPNVGRGGRGNEEEG